MAVAWKYLDATYYLLRFSWEQKFMFEIIKLSEEGIISVFFLVKTSKFFKMGGKFLKIFDWAFGIHRKRSINRMRQALPGR